MSSRRCYNDALTCLSKLISGRKRVDVTRSGNPIVVMKNCIKILELEEPLKKLSVIHVAGTKGKGSTCAFTESILRNSGFKTALFTSPHLIDVRERFKVGGKDISEESFVNHFWWCYDKLKAIESQKNSSPDFSMPPYFRFLTLLAFRIFTSENIDVVILEVGIGGRFDSTNVIDSPVVCGITSLGYDHMNILGNTLSEIAFEKAGIFKRGVPAFTVPQEEEAMKVLNERANALNVPLSTIYPSTYLKDSKIKLGIQGNHQLINANLAIALCRKWIESSEIGKSKEEEKRKSNTKTDEEIFSDGRLPTSYLQGLENTSWLGRSQIIPYALSNGNRNTPIGFQSFIPSLPLQDSMHSDSLSITKNAGSRLTFFLDGAHSPESLLACGRWFSEEALLSEKAVKTATQDALFRRILLFNCMPERDPCFILPPLLSQLETQGLIFHRAVFVPSMSSYSTLQKPFDSNSNPSDTQPAGLSWQKEIQEKWETMQSASSPQSPLSNPYSKRQIVSCTSSPSSDFLIQYQEPGMNFVLNWDAQDDESNNPNSNSNTSNRCYLSNTSILMPSLPRALDYLRKCAKENPQLHLQVLVTGSLHLVGDMLQLIRSA